MFVLLATFLLYARTLSCRFAFDDNYQILGSSHILGRWPEARNEFIMELAINRENVPAKNALAETDAHLQAAQDQVVQSRQSSDCYIKLTLVEA